MNILILGNGFDLAHGLPTRYTDFLAYCRDTISTSNSGAQISKSENVNREFLALITDNVWLSYFLKKTPDLDANKTWIDFEIEISTAIIDLCNKAFTASRKSTNARGINQHIENIKIQEHFGRFVCFENNRLTYKTLELFKELQKFTNALGIYFCEKAQAANSRNNFNFNEDILLSYFEEEKVNTYIVSFNYTRTFEHLYDVTQNEDNKIDYNYVFLHGESNIDYLKQGEDAENFLTNNLVLGTHSFTREDNKTVIPVGFNIFQKHNQQHKYNTLFDYQNLLKELRGYCKPVNIFVVGHSLEKSDHAKLKILLCECKTADITVYYHDEASFEKYIGGFKS